MNVVRLCQLISFFLMFKETICNKNIKRVLRYPVGYLKSGCRSMILLLTVTGTGNYINSPKSYLFIIGALPFNNNAIQYTCIMYIAKYWFVKMMTIYKYYKAICCGNCGYIPFDTSAKRPSPSYASDGLSLVFKWADLVNVIGFPLKRIF